MQQLNNCVTCGGKVSSNANACPHCGETFFSQEKIYDFNRKSRETIERNEANERIQTLYDKKRLINEAIRNNKSLKIRVNTEKIICVREVLPVKLWYYSSYDSSNSLMKEEDNVLLVAHCLVEGKVYYFGLLKELTVLLNPNEQTTYVKGTNKRAEYSENDRAKSSISGLIGCVVMAVIASLIISLCSNSCS